MEMVLEENLLSAEVQSALKYLPHHARILEKSVAILKEHEDVVGCCIAGSVANNSAHELSDLDVFVVVRSNQLEKVWEQRKALENSIDQHYFRCDLTDIYPYSSAAYYDNFVKLHVQYVEEGKMKPHPNLATSAVLFDKANVFKEWLEKCHSSIGKINTQMMANLDQKFWLCVLYGSPKIARGEFWSAYNVLTKMQLLLIQMQPLLEKRLSSGFRRLESEWQEIDLHRLSQTIAAPQIHELIPAYKEAIRFFQEIRIKLSENYEVNWEVDNKAIQVILGEAEKRFKEGEMNHS